jgi:hypothetical protein
MSIMQILKCVDVITKKEPSQTNQHAPIKPHKAQKCIGYLHLYPLSFVLFAEPYTTSMGPAHVCQARFRQRLMLETCDCIIGTSPIV